MLEGLIQLAVKRFAIASMLSVAICSCAVRAEQADALRLYKQGCAETKAGRTEQALQCINKAIEIDNKNALYYAQKAVILFKIEDDEIAVVAADKALSIDPKCTTALIAKGKALGRLGKSEEGVKCLTRALELQPNTIEAIHHRARIYLALNNFKAAESDLKQALKIGRTSTILVDKIRADEGLHQWQNAVDDSTALITLLTDAKSAFRSKGLRSRAHAYMELKKYPQAIVDLEEAVKLWPHDIRIHQNLYKALKANGNEQQAAREAEKIKSLQADM